MPIPIKVFFSIVVLAVAIAGYYFLDWFGGGEGASRFVSLFLGIFAVISFWIFPEVTKKK